MTEAALASLLGRSVSPATCAHLLQAYGAADPLTPEQVEAQAQSM